MYVLVSITTYSINVENTIELLIQFLRLRWSDSDLMQLFLKNFRAQYWASLFEYLRHTIYELRQICENDENISECEEVILVLENYTREFHELAKWFRMKCEYDNTPPSQRPTSVAWGVSKASPGKMFRKNAALSKQDSACRELIFEVDVEANGNTETSHVLPLHMKLNHLENVNAINGKVNENGLDVINNNNNNNSLLHSVDIETSTLTEIRSIDCSCQTDDEMLAIKKTVPVNRRSFGSSPSHPKRIVRNTMSTLTEKSFSSSSSPSTKRLSGCTSPTKPTPGRNIAAPVFKPRTLTDMSKVKISRSHSDPVFETTNLSLKSFNNEKHPTSTESPKNVDKENRGPKSPVNPMEVIVEHTATESTVFIGEPEFMESHENDTRRNPTVEKISTEIAPVIFGEEVEQITEHLKLPTNVSDIIIDVTPVTKTTTSQDTNLDGNTEFSDISSSANDVAVAQPTAIHEPIVTSLTLSENKISQPMVEQKLASDTTKPVEAIRRTPGKNNITSRVSTRQWDTRSQSTTASRKINETVASSVSRPVNNQNYVKDVGVPKTFNETNFDRRYTSERNTQVNAISSSEPRKPTLNRNGKRSSFVAALKENPKAFDPSNSQRDRKESSARHHLNMVRSKTFADMKSKTLSMRQSSVVKTSSEERDVSQRSRRSSKDIDGWETVTNRSKRSFPTSLNVKEKSKFVNRRFYEPSPSTSLPSLTIGNCQDKFSDSIKSERNKNRNRNSTGQSSNGNTSKQDNHEKVDNISNGNLNYKLDEERPILSNTAIFTTIESKRKKSYEKDTKKARPKESKRKSSKESNVQNTSESEDQLNEESLRKSKELYEEEISLRNEIKELQKDDLEIDGDSDSTEIDSEIAELYQNKEITPTERRALLESKYSHLLSKMTWAEQVDALETLEELMESDPSGKGLKFAKNCTSLEQVEDFMMRWPGRAMEIHQKLSSPSRKRGDISIQEHTARQAKAKQNREQLHEGKALKIEKLFKKVAEVKAMQAALAEDLRIRLDQKHQRATENRNLHLKKKKEKAHDEAKKQKEIAFINELEAQNKRHDFYASCQEQEDRLQSRKKKRQIKKEEKAAKKAAVEERRKAIEAERQEKIEELQEKMRKQKERLDREQQEKERERIKAAREKARDREDRKLALHAAQIANAEELQKKIQQKQESSARRHEESIELIRQRAIEHGTPRLTPYQTNKLCSVCNVVIDSDVFLLSHLRGSSHQEALKKYREQFEASVKFSECSIIMDAPADILREKKSREKERQRSLRKRCKKIRQRLSARSESYLKETRVERTTSVKKADSPSQKRMLKSIKEIEKLINSQGSAMWPNNTVTTLERNLFEVIRVLEKKDENDQRAFAEYDGFTILSKIYSFALDLPKNMSPFLPLKCFVVASNLYISACNNHVDNCLYVLLSNKIVQILEFLLNRLNLIMPSSDDRNGVVVYKADTVADVLMHLCSTVLSSATSVTSNGENKVEISQHLQDVVSYIVCTGIVDKLAVYCSSVHDDKSANSFFLLHAIQFLTRLVETRLQSTVDKEDYTSLMATLKATELVGAVSMLYSILLYQDSMSTADCQSTMTILQPDVVNVIIAALQLFSRVCELNLEFFQNILGAEGISLQVRHIISYLLKYCVQNGGYSDLLHQVIEFIGFFAIHHHENQMILQSGSTPTVLQQLSSLPFMYFSDPKLVRILFPTLLACCVDNPLNKTILDQEMSFQLLTDFENAEESKNIPLIKLLH